jgi:hypothetical protein
VQLLLCCTRTTRQCRHHCYSHRCSVLYRHKAAITRYVQYTLGWVQTEYSPSLYSTVVTPPRLSSFSLRLWSWQVHPFSAGDLCSTDRALGHLLTTPITAAHMTTMRQHTIPWSIKTHSTHASIRVTRGGGRWGSRSLPQPPLALLRPCHGLQDPRSDRLLRPLVVDILDSCHVIFNALTIVTERGAEVVGFVGVVGLPHEVHGRRDEGVVHDEQGREGGKEDRDGRGRSREEKQG